MSKFLMFPRFGRKLFPYSFFSVFLSFFSFTDSWKEMEKLLKKLLAKKDINKSTKWAKLETWFTFFCHMQNPGSFPFETSLFFFHFHRNSSLHEMINFLQLSFSYYHRIGNPDHKYKKKNNFLTYKRWHSVYY